MIKPFDMIILFAIAVVVIMIFSSRSNNEQFTSEEVQKSCNTCNVPDKLCYNPTNVQTCDVPMYTGKTGNRCDPFCNINTTKGCNSDSERQIFVNMELNRQAKLGIDRINLPKLTNPILNAEQPANINNTTQSVEYFDSTTDVEQPDILNQQNNFREKLWSLSNSSEDVVKRVAEINENCDCIQGKAISEVYDDLVKIKTNGNQCEGYIGGTSIPHTLCPLRAGVDENDPNSSLYYVDGANGRCYKPDVWTYADEHGANGGTLYDNLVGADPMWSDSPIV